MSGAVSVWTSFTRFGLHQRQGTPGTRPGITETAPNLNGRWKEDCLCVSDPTKQGASPVLSGARTVDNQNSLTILHIGLRAGCGAWPQQGFDQKLNSDEAYTSHTHPFTVKGPFLNARGLWLV
eukprot:1160354-Pelagomonas_calceolata.AAC.4